MPSIGSSGAREAREKEGEGGKGRDRWRSFSLFFLANAERKEGKEKVRRPFRRFLSRDAEKLQEEGGGK